MNSQDYTTSEEERKTLTEEAVVKQKRPRGRPPKEEAKPVTEDQQIQKPKRVLTEAQRAAALENMKKGQAALAVKRAAQRAAAEEREAQVKQEREKQAQDFKMRTEKALNRKMNAIKREKDIAAAMLKQAFSDDSDIEAVEEHIVKKPKKKRIIYREESDSEVDVVVKRRPAQQQQQTQHTDRSERNGSALPMFNIKFC
jgi:hypothetical protein